jgi:hypothetical protein
MPPVRISSKSARQIFHGCEPGYIAEVCHGACCRRSAGPIIVTILPREEAQLRKLGAPIEGGLLAPEQKRCPFQTAAELCGLHGSGAKPFGCIASPFMLTARDTLIVRNRYRLLRCFRDGELPAFEAFRASLDLLFGHAEAEQLCARLRGGSGDFWAYMLDDAYAELHAGDDAKKRAAGLKP